MPPKPTIHKLNTHMSSQTSNPFQGPHADQPSFEDLISLQSSQHHRDSSPSDGALSDEGEQPNQKQKSSGNQSVVQVSREEFRKAQKPQQ